MNRAISCCERKSLRRREIHLTTVEEDKIKGCASTNTHTTHTPHTHTSHTPHTHTTHTPEDDVCILLFQCRACCHGNACRAESHTAEWHAVFAVDGGHLVHSLLQPQVPAPEGERVGGHRRNVGYRPVHAILSEACL